MSDTTDVAVVFADAVKGGTNDPDELLTFPDVLDTKGVRDQVVQAIETIETIWVAYRDGYAQPHEAFRKIAAAYAEAIRPLEAQVAQLNDEVKGMLKTVAVGTGETRITIADIDIEFTLRQSSTRVTVDHKAALKVVEALTAEGHPLAVALLDAFKTTPVAMQAAVGKVTKR